MTKDKSILLISYYFPPLGGVGISRPLALFQYLPELGYDCKVLTVKPVLYRAYEPELLSTLNKDHVFRAGSTDPSRLLYIMGVRNVRAKSADQGRFILKRFFPDSKAGWIGPATRLGKKLIKNNQFDLIVSTSPPVSAHVVAMELAKISKIPWVADFRDFWTSYKAADCFDSEDKKEKAKELLEDIKRTAQAIVAVNKSVADYVGASEIIHNSYDSQLAKKWLMPVNRSKFTIGVFGTINELTPIYPLINVIKSVKKNQPEIYSRISVLSVGLADKEFLEREISELGMSEIFDFRGFQSRSRAIDLMSEASMFYLGVSDLGFGLTTNRIFTLFSSGRPILGYTESGSEFDRIMSNYSNAFLFNDYKIEEARKFLSTTVEQYFQGNLLTEIEPDSVKEFSSRRMVEKFARLFNLLTKS